ncbi:MAG: hypothetical protein JST26_07760 [Bacteroidetes bacterium]|nr:hypothetical protein [Bacteroidota bacterium]
MTKQLADTYKKLSTAKLLDIIENRKDYQPIAIEIAKLELAGRQDIEQAKSEVRKKNDEAQKKLAEKKQRRKEASDKALKVLEYADPLIEKTPEKTIVIICTVLLLAFLFKTVTGFNLIISAFKDIANGDFTVSMFLLEYFYLPVAVFFLWKKTVTGWKMLLIWLVYQLILDCSGLYLFFKMSGIGDSFMQFMPMPDLSAILFGVVFHGGLIYFIFKPNVKALFPDKSDNKSEIEKSDA